MPRTVQQLPFSGSHFRRRTSGHPPVSVCRFLEYDSKQHVHSAVQVQTNLAALQDDVQAILNFNLAAERVALVLYTACNYHGSPSATGAGMGLGINVDTVDVATQYTSPNQQNYANGATVLWVGLLSAGAHTIKGRFSSESPGNNVTIDERRLLVVLFTGPATSWFYTRDTTLVQTANAALQDDPQAQFTFTPCDNCKALIVYATCNYSGDLEISFGKRIAIQTDGVDGAIDIYSSPGWLADNMPAHNFIGEIRSLAVAAHTIRGRYATAIGGNTVSISERQFAILLFDDDLPTDFVGSINAVNIVGNVLGDDTEAIVNRVTAEDRHVLAIYSASRAHGTTPADWNLFGKKVAVQIDATDYTLNARSPRAANRGNCAGIQSDVETLAAGAHSIRGRFANNDAVSIAIVDRRTLCVLWFT